MFGTGFAYELLALKLKKPTQVSEDSALGNFFLSMGRAYGWYFQHSRFFQKLENTQFEEENDCVIRLN